MKIFLTGGGTAGSVTPLLAVAQQLRQHELWFVGTSHGVERSLVPDHIHYLSVPAGKWRRYFSWRNLVDPVVVVVAFFYSLWLLVRYAPQVIVSAGSFVSVPVVWAAWWCNVPVVIHQQDLQVGLATRLMRLAAHQVTKAFPEIPLRDAVHIGNPVRSLTPTTQQFKLDTTVPTVLIFGGGTGAAAINRLVTPELCKQANVIHLTGKGKTGLAVTELTIVSARYHQFELLTDAMAEALHVADVVVCRAGLGTLSELAVLKKPTIVIPIPQSHQEHNAKYFADHKAVVSLNQLQLTPTLFTQTILRLLADRAERQRLAEAIGQMNQVDAASQLAAMIERYDLAQS